MFETIAKIKKIIAALLVEKKLPELFIGKTIVQNVKKGAQ